MDSPSEASNRDGAISRYDVTEVNKASLAGRLVIIKGVRGRGVRGDGTLSESCRGFP